MAPNLEFKPSSLDGLVPLDRRFLHVNMDIAERCNLECMHCPYVHMRSLLDEPTTITTKFIHQLEQEVFPIAARVSLSSYHEPLMASEKLFATIEAVNRCDVPSVDVVTNGLLLDESSAEFLLRHTNLIRISGDGASAVTYEEMRKGASFSLFIDKIRLLTNLRKRLHLEENVSITLTACIINRNVHECVDFVNLANELGFDSLELRLTKISSVVALAHDDQICHHPHEADAYLAASRKRAAEIGLSLSSPPTLAEIRANDFPRPQFTNCLFPWREVQITPQGGVTPCCMWHSMKDLGNMIDSSFAEVWNGDEFRRLRWEFETSQLSRPGCVNCEVHFSAADRRYWMTYQFE